ncbi:MAG TPA: hypothetical protein P5056_02765 [Candidatus Paceibacterota bacterium]|nr:hypothetical protein [Candidatus Paceibacterota bacterium]
MKKRKAQIQDPPVLSPFVEQENERIVRVVNKSFFFLTIVSQKSGVTQDALMAVLLHLGIKRMNTDKEYEKKIVELAGKRKDGKRPGPDDTVRKLR